MMCMSSYIKGRCSIFKPSRKKWLCCSVICEWMQHFICIMLQLASGLMGFCCVLWLVTAGTRDITRLHMFMPILPISPSLARWSERVPHAIGIATPNWVRLLGRCYSTSPEVHWRSSMELRWGRSSLLWTPRAGNTRVKCSRPLYRTWSDHETQPSFYCVILWCKFTHRCIQHSSSRLSFPAH